MYDVFANHLVLGIEKGTLISKRISSYLLCGSWICFFSNTVENCKLALYVLISFLIAFMILGGFGFFLFSFRFTFCSA